MYWSDFEAHHQSSSLSQSSPHARDISNYADVGDRKKLLENRAASAGLSP
jgi:hypothetical protein